MSFQTHVTIGDVAVLVALAGNVLYFIFGVGWRIQNTDFKVEELRRGRGLVMKDWPIGFQRVMGFINGHHRHDD